MNYYLFIPFVLILIFFFPVKLKAKFSCNLLNLSGVIALFFYKVKILHQQFLVKNGKIIIKGEQEVNEKEIEFNGKELLFFDIFLKQIKNKTRVKELFLFYNVGLDDALLSSMVAGYINLACFIFFTNLKNTKPTASLGVYDTVSYNRLVFELAFKIVLTISLFDIVYSLVISLIKTNKIAKRQKQLKKDEAKLYS